MPPSQLQIATSALRRLVKEEASYHQEMKGQEERIAKMGSGGEEAEGEEGNREFSLRQEVSSLVFLYICLGDMGEGGFGAANFDFGPRWRVLLTYSVFV